MPSPPPSYEWTERRLKSLQTQLNDGLSYSQLACNLSCRKADIERAVRDHGVRKQRIYTRRGS